VSVEPRKIVAVTGGAQGIGRGVALGFARAGYAVSIADPDAAAGREVAGILKNAGGEALFVRTDVSKEADVKAWMARTVKALGAPDVLVNNAGIMKRTPFLMRKVAEFDRIIAINLRSAFMCSQLAARAMVRAKKGGAIVNIASTRAFMSEPDTEPYSASKGGIVALTHAMAISLGGQGIRVNCVSPGWIETCDWQYSKRAVTPKHSEADRKQHPVGRVGTPEDIAEACLFLAERAGFMTGQTITIDGGMTVKMIYAE
jgi:NAD(P)-dependent dehydrogenase (short-subunit alcohol dehydrogenase family)